MRLKITLFLGVVFFLSFLTFRPVIAEDKDIPSGIIPKLPKTANDPELFNNFVYPMWGPVCQRYTYTVTYRDKEGRPPEYVKIYFNGQMIDMTPTLPKASLGKEDYQKGVRYEYKFVPNKLGSNFYYFEASNGVGKTRASIIDSPDNGPVLFEGDFLHNEIALIDNKTGKKIFSYPTKEEWIGGVALSDDGRYLAAKTSYKIILFDTSKLDEPLWVYTHGENPMMIGGDLKGGVGISGDGSKIIAAIGNNILLFNKSSNQPVWKYDIESNAYNVAISKDGKYTAAATGGEESNPNSNLLILWGNNDSKPLWQYHSSGNFHDVSLSDNGQYIAGSTGCPDRRFYLFSNNSNNPLIKSEMLTRDSPVHRAKISSDGNFAAVGSESDRGAVFLFSKGSKEPVWQFPTPNGSSVRALNFTPDGKYIGASTFGGQAYIFEKSLKEPVASWTFNAALGGIDIADDGSFIVVGGTDNKIHIFSKDQKTKIEVPFEEYIEEVDVSANGKYTAVGTGGSVYFFETISKDPKTIPCTTIIEPRPIEKMMNGGLGVGEQINSTKLQNNQIKLPGMLFGFGFIGSLLFLLTTIAINKLQFLSGLKTAFIQLNATKLSSLKLTSKKITIMLSVLTVLFLFLTIASAVLNKNPNAVLLKKGEQAKSQPGKIIMNEGKQQGGVCGNNVCEPDFGESKEKCPKDCSAGE